MMGFHAASTDKINIDLESDYRRSESHDMIVVMGDLKAKVGKNKTLLET